MKVLRAVMFAAVCALTTAGAATAPLLDVERSGTVVIVAGTPTAAPPVGLDEVLPTISIEPPSTTAPAESGAVEPTTSVTPTTTTLAGSDVVEPTTVAETPTMTTVTGSEVVEPSTVVETPTATTLAGSEVSVVQDVCLVAGEVQASGDGSDVPTMTSQPAAVPDVDQGC